MKLTRERVGIIALGHTVNRIEVILFDHVLYGAVALYCSTTWGVWGPLICFLLMLPASALMCYAFIVFYDWAKRDWLGIEALKHVREAEFHGWFGRYAARVIRKGDIAAFFALSLYGDPFMTTLYLRKGVEKYDGMTQRDWLVFWSSVVLSNGYWTLRWSLLVEVALFVCRAVHACTT